MIESDGRVSFAVHGFSKAALEKLGDRLLPFVRQHPVRLLVVLGMHLLLLLRMLLMRLALAHRRPLMAVAAGETMP